MLHANLFEVDCPNKSEIIIKQNYSELCALNQTSLQGDVVSKVDRDIRTVRHLAYSSNTRYLENIISNWL